MEPSNIIEAFLQVVENQAYIFDKQSREDLNTIKQRLIGLENQPLEAAAEAITNWCQEHETIRNAVLFTARSITPKKRNPDTQGTTLSNKYPEYKTKLDTQINSTEPENSNNQNQN